MLLHLSNKVQGTTRLGDTEPEGDGPDETAHRLWVDQEAPTDREEVGLGFTGTPSEE